MFCITFLLHSCTINEQKTGNDKTTKVIGDNIKIDEKVNDIKLKEEVKKKDYTVELQIENKEIISKKNNTFKKN